MKFFNNLIKKKMDSLKKTLLKSISKLIESHLKDTMSNTVVFTSIEDENPQIQWFQNVQS